MTKSSQKTNPLRTVWIGALLLIYPAFLSLLDPSTVTYITLYVALIAFMFASLEGIKNYLRIIVFFLTIYLSIALLNISTWRGNTSTETLYLYSWAMYFMIAPMLAWTQNSKPQKFKPAHQQDLLKIVIFTHILTTYLALGIVYLSVGNIFLQQHLRFQIPTSLEYTIKSALPIAAVLPFISTNRQALWLISIIIPAILIGSRGTAIIAMLAYAIVLLHKSGGGVSLNNLLIKSRIFLVYGITGFIIISVLFYVRRGGDHGLAPTDVVMENYFEFDNLFIRAILPLYLGFKETVGLSNLIITENIHNNLSSHTLLFADLFTILPGENLSAGQAVAQIFGASQDGGLTPGLLGGTYIDFKELSLLVFFIFGTIFAWLQRSTSASPYFIIIYAQAITQFIHLFHRGFLKPEYITSILIAAFYFFLCHRTKP